MTTAGEEPEKPNGRTLDDTVREAEEYYKYLNEKHLHDSRIDALVASVLVWFATFAVLGFGAFTTIKGDAFYQYLFGAFLAAVGLGAAAGIAFYLTRRKRGSKFAELGSLISKMKSGGASSEEGVRLMDAMHQASLVLKKRKMDTALEYGLIAFVLVAIIGTSGAIGALAGVVVYLYFRFEALREYERDEKRYEDSKRELLQSI
jgi:ABC-type multidrug transport system fused ATPase/permease subunit